MTEPRCKTLATASEMEAFEAPLSVPGGLGPLPRLYVARQKLCLRGATDYWGPDYPQRTLTVELHRLGSPLQDAAVAKLCEELNATETCFPTTDLKLIYRQVGSA
jgi:hypothetical protein